jgi:hypothetical protein
MLQGQVFLNISQHEIGGSTTGCNQIVSGLNLFLHNNKTFLLVGAVCFKVVSLGLGTESPVISLQFQVFLEEHLALLCECCLVSGGTYNLTSHHTHRLDFSWITLRL